MPISRDFDDRPISIDSSARPRPRQAAPEPLRLVDWIQELASLVAAVLGGAGLILGAAAVGDALRALLF